MQKYYGWGLPYNASAYGGDVDRLIYVLHGFMILLFTGWLIFLVVALFKFRSRPGHQAVYKPNHFKAPTYIEVGVALFEAILLIGFSFPIARHVRTLPPKGEALEVRVVAEQFAWNIHYPGPDGVFGKTDIQLMGPGNPVGLDRNDSAAKDDITVINQLHVPVNKPVIVHLSSKDVIHSFFLPVMRVKQDVIPGQNVPVWFQAKDTGNFEIACAQLCGLGHYRMRGFLIVETPEQFAAWQAKYAPKVPAPAPVQTPVSPAPVAKEQL